MKTDRDVAFLFGAAALCDGLLGIAFLILPRFIFGLLGAAPPSHLGYIQFSALVMVVFSIMFAQIAASPRTYRHLVPYGILLKASFCCVVFGWWLVAGVPFLWKPLAVADVGFLILFVWAYRMLAEDAAS